MKKSSIIAFILVTLLAILTGCTKNLGSKNTEKSVINSTAANASKNVSSPQKSSPTINDVKNLDDSKLIDQILKEEDALILDDVDPSVEDLDAIDAILNEKDLIANIPANVKVDK